MHSKSLIEFYKPLKAYIRKAQNQAGTIGSERRLLLDELASYIREKGASGDQANLVFICTHNSRRSIMSQIFAQTMAALYGIENVMCYSGGTEATAFNPRAVDAMKRAGFKILKSGEENPRYSVFYSDHSTPIFCFSKVYNDDENPDINFAAVMTCSDAERNCPFIPGTDRRFSISYEDPKEADNTSYESERYDERALQIASEMFYAMSRV